jgi:hypothetical protein
MVGRRNTHQIVHAATAVMIPAKPKKAFFDCSARSRGVGIVILIQTESSMFEKGMRDQEDIKKK